MATIDDIRKANPSVYGGLTSYEIVDRLSQLTGRHPDAIGYDLGVAPRNAGGFGTAFKSSVGSMVQGVGQLGGDVLPGIGNDNAMERYGREVTQRNPVTIMEGSGSALENIGTNLVERPLNTIGQVTGGALGFMGPGGAAKLGLGAYRGIRGIQAVEAASGLGKAAGMTGEAAYYGLPSYGQIRDVQESTGNNSFADKIKAGLGALAVGGIETFAGPEAALARGIKNVGGAGKNFVRTGLKQGAFEAGEEMLQQPIEAFASGKDPFSRESIDQALAGGVAGFIGGMPMGMAMHPFMKKSETANTLMNNEKLDLTNSEPVRTNASVAQERVNAGRNLPQMGLETQDVLMVTPTGDVLTTQEQVDAWNNFGKNLSAPVLTLETAKSRKELKSVLDQNFEAGSITQEQHADATNVIDMAKNKKFADIKTSVMGITASQAEELPAVTVEADALLNDIDAKKVVVPAAMTGGLKGIAKANGIVVKKTDTPDSIIGQLRSMRDTAATQKNAEVGATQAATTPISPVTKGSAGELHLTETESPVYEGNLTQAEMALQDQQAALTENAEPEVVQQFAQNARQELASALSAKQAQALAVIYGVRNEQDTDWEVVPSSTRAAAKGMGVKHSTVDENAKTGMKKLLKRAKDLGISEQAAIRIMGLQGEGVADVNAISTGQAAQAGLTYRGSATDTPSYRWDEASNVMGDNEELDTTAENYVPEQLSEAAFTEDVGAPVEVAPAAEVAVDETALEEDNAPVTEDLSAVDENAAYEVDYDLNKDDMDDAKYVWQQLRESFAAEGIEVPEWKDISASAFEKFAAATKYHLNNPQGEKSITEMRTAQVEASNARQTTGTNEQAVVGTTQQTKKPNDAVSEKPAAAASTEKRGGKAKQTVKRSEGSINTAQETEKSDADTIRTTLKKLFLSPAKFDNLISIVQSIQELPLNVVKAAKLTLDNSTVQGFVLKGKVYLIADNITPGREQSVLMHELGVHVGMANILTPKELKGLATQVAEWSQRTDNSLETRISKAAMRRAGEANQIAIEDRGAALTEEIYVEEVAAYFVEEAVMAGVEPSAKAFAKPNTVQAWINKLVSAFKNALVKIGMGRFDLLSTQDIIDFAYGAANMELTRPTNRTRKGGSTAKFSRSAVSKAVESAGNYTSEFIDDLPPGVGENIRYASDAVGNMAKKGLWYSMFTNDLINTAKKVIPTAQRWYDQLNAKAVDQIKREAEVDAIANDSDKLPREQFVRTWDLIKRMTGNQKWAYQPTWRDTVAIDQDYAKEYNALSKEEQTLIDRVFKHGDESIKEIQAILDQILNDELQAKLAKAKTDEERATINSQEKKFKAMFGRKLTQLEGPYAPMRRVGSHVVVARSQELIDAVENRDTKLIEKLREDENAYKVLFVDSMAEAKREQRRLEGKYASVRASEKDSFTSSAQMLPFEAFDQIRKMASEKEGDVAGKLNNLITELYLTSLAETSSRKAELRRENIAGLNSDTMYKAFVSKGRASAHYVATLKNSKAVAESFAQMRQEARANTDMVIFNELAQRYANSIKYDPMPVAGKIMAFNTIWSLLTKPAYYLYNATQPALMTLPYFSQRFAYSKAAGAMTQAYKDIAGAKGFMSLKDAVLHVDSMPKDVQRALRDLLDSGKLDITITQDLGSRVAAGQGKVSRGMALVDRTLRTAAQKVETTNRLVTAIAAYRLAMEDPNATHESAVKYAAKAIDQTQGDYSNFNAPRLFNQTSFQRVITQFRKFQLIQISFIVRMFKDAMVGATKADRIAARKALGFVLAHHAALAGALGLPAANVIAWAFSAAGDDDEPRDLELEMRKALGNDFMADLITRGAPAALLNVNVSGNVGMGQAFSLLPFTDVDFKSREGYNAVLAGSMGPFIGGVMPQAWTALGSFGRGDYYKGLEGVMPSGARNALRAMREGVEGATNTRGDELVSPDEISLGETFAKILGFRTNTDSTRQLIRSRTYEFEQFFKDRTSQLKNEYARAYRDGDVDAMSDIRDNWTEMNQFKREYGFTVQPISKLLQAPRERAKREKDTVGGVQVKKSNKRFVESLTETDEE